MSWVFRLPKEVETSVNAFRFDGAPGALALRGFSVVNDGRGGITVRALGSGTTCIRKCPHRCYAMVLCGWGCGSVVVRCPEREYDSYSGMLFVDGGGALLED